MHIRKSLDAYLQANSQLWLVMLCVLAFVLSYFSPLESTTGDSRGTLLTAQAIITQKTVALDAYKDTIADYAYRIYQKDGHYYYTYPLGTSLYAIPFVWMANLRGADMRNPTDDDHLQVLLACFTLVIVTVLLYSLARCFLDTLHSFLFTVAVVFGSSVISTMGIGLWNLNLEVIFILFTWLLICRAQQKRIKPNAFLLGFLLFSAYLCRPSAASFILATLGYLLLTNWKLAVKVGAVSAVLLGGFILFSLRTYHSVLPWYYLPGLKNPNFLLALYGHLFSPARGILVYSPYLVLTCVGAVCYIKRLYRDPLVGVAIGWFVFHWLAGSNFPQWWGGWCFGARLLLDALPALLLLSLLVWKQVIERASARVYGIAMVCLLPLIGFSIFVHTFQGLYNPYTAIWNASPNIDQYPEYLFDWQHPQFLASPESLQDRNQKHARAVLSLYQWNESVLPASSQAAFIGWHIPEAENTWVWSAGASAEVMLKVSPNQVAQYQNFVLEINASAYHTQTVTVQVNGTAVGIIEGQTVESYQFPISAAVLRADNQNGSQFITVRFVTPGALSPAVVQPGNGDQRILGVEFRELKLYPVAEE